MLLDRLNHLNERKKRKPDLLFALCFFGSGIISKRSMIPTGHQVGDNLLIEVSKRLETGLRASDTVARPARFRNTGAHAGDEFVCID